MTTNLAGIDVISFDATSSEGLKRFDHAHTLANDLKGEIRGLNRRVIREIFIKKTQISQIPKVVHENFAFLSRLALTEKTAIKTFTGFETNIFDGSIYALVQIGLSLHLNHNVQSLTDSATVSEIVQYHDKLLAALIKDIH